MRLGIFGGTFDPPHLGHLILACDAAGQLSLDRVLWVLTPSSPFKQGAAISPVEVRLELVRAAITDLPNHILSEVELQRPAPQYTLDTVKQLKLDYPRDQIIYLIGGDSLQDLPRWHRPQELVEAVDGFGVMRRPQTRIELPELEAQLPGLTDKIQWVDSPRIQISASDIRNRILQGRPFRYFVPEAVYNLIETRKLYR